MAEWDDSVRQLGSLTSRQKLACSLCLVGAFPLESFHLLLLFSLLLDLLGWSLVSSVCLENVLTIAHMVFVFLFINNISKLIDKVSEIFLDQEVKSTLFSKTSEMAILFSKETEICSDTFKDIMHSNQETLLLDVLYSDQDAMTILNFHALTMYNVMIIWIFLIKTKLNLLQTSKVIEGKDKSACLSWFLNLKPHVGDISELLDSSVNVFKTFIQDWNVMISFGFDIFCEFAEEIFRWLFILTVESWKLVCPCSSVGQSTLNLFPFIIIRD